MSRFFIPLHLLAAALLCISVCGCAQTQLPGSFPVSTGQAMTYSSPTIMDY